jgi:hypothetical protein
MLYLHCGLPKTGTTSLQAAFAGNRSGLAASGAVYPERWTQRDDPSHKLFAEDTPEDAIGKLKEFLMARTGENVLLSSEALSIRAIRGEFHQILVRLIATARQAMPVRCIWTLRRFDDMVHSACLQRMTHGLEAAPPDRIEMLDPRPLFAVMRALEEAADETVYVGYGAGGEHQAEMLAAFGLSGTVAEAVLHYLENAPRQRVGVSHKQAVALLDPDGLSERCGVDLDRSRLRELFQGAFRFEDDRHCELFSAEARRELHEKALASAREFDIQVYERLFADAEIPPSPAPPGDDPSALNAADVRHLASVAKELARG